MTDCSQIPIPDRRRAEPGFRSGAVRGGGIALFAAIVFAGLVAAPAIAFHRQGVGSCADCHSMHNSEDGMPVIIPGSGDMLLRGQNATEVCLSCHESDHGAVLGRDPRNPPPELGAGNFTYLLEDNLNDGWDTGGEFQIIGGHRAGHSIIAPSWRLDADPDYLVAPGGSYPSRNMGCTSCHDPHGNTNFRMLWGAGQSTADGFLFTSAAPLAEGIDIHTQTESPTSHTAYQSGWTDWCANCHGDYHEGAAAFEHPGDDNMSGYQNGYNDYDGPSNPYDGDYSSAYLPEVPIEDPSMTVDGTVGAFGSSRLSCMTCHRAHATSGPGAVRWDPNVVRLGDDGVISFSYPIPNPYGDPEQRGLCVKCHYQEAADHGMEQACLSCHSRGRNSALPSDRAFFDPFPASGFRR